MISELFFPLHFSWTCVCVCVFPNTLTYLTACKQVQAPIMVIKVSQGGSGSGVLNSGLMAELGTPPSGTPLCLWSPRKTRRPQGAQFESHTQKLCTQAGGGHWVWALLTPVSGLQPSTNISHVVFSNHLWKFVELQPLSLCFFFSLGIQFKSLFSLIILPCFPLPYIRL